MTTLITGATGFAGSHLIDRLAGSADLAAWHRPTRPTPTDPRAAWTAVDLTDRASVRKAITALQPTEVYHVAGAARVDTSWDNVVPHLEANVLGTHHLIDALAPLAGRCRVVVVTSAMVYDV